MAWERRQRGGCTLYRSGTRGRAERASILSGVPREEIREAARRRRANHLGTADRDSRSRLMWMATRDGQLRTQSGLRPRTLPPSSLMPEPAERAARRGKGSKLIDESVAGSLNLAGALSFPESFIFWAVFDFCPHRAA